MKTSVLKYYLMVIFSCAAAEATHAGSVISSFFAAPIEHNGNEAYPTGLTYGDGYVWVHYVAINLMTKRNPVNGSIVGSYNPGSMSFYLAWDRTRAYIYDANWFGYICWYNSSTGSVVGSFYKPPEIYQIAGIAYDPTHPVSPIWVGETMTHMLYQLNNYGSIVNSYMLPGGLWPECLAFDPDTAGGPFLFVGIFSEPSVILKVNPSTGSILTSFEAPVAGHGLCDMGWDGQYLWGLENGPPPSHPGWVYRFVAHEYPAVAPVSFGKIKALFQ